MTLPRIIVSLLVLFAVITAISFVLFSAGREVPGNGQGDTIELPS
jgi:hypothetical protein